MQQKPSSLPASQESGSRLPLIYILGNSHCGSTLFGFLLSANPDIINVGELKTRSWLKDRFCTCGHDVEECPLYKDYFPTFNTLKQKIVKEGGNYFPLRFLFQKKINPGAQHIAALTQLHLSLSEKIKTLYPRARYMTDCSKSVWLLNDWLHTLPTSEIKIIWLKRNRNANVSSFVKRGYPFLTSLMKISINNRIMHSFLRKNKLNYLEVNYDDFYAAFEKVARDLSTFLGIDIPVEFKDNHNHHVISGNSRTRNTFATQFKGIHRDEEWKQILSPFQKKVLSWIS
jgi:hypothetical protein